MENDLLATTTIDDLGQEQDNIALSCVEKVSCSVNYHNVHIPDVAPALMHWLS